MTAIEILDKYGIRKSDIREKILNTFLENMECLTYAEIIKKIKWTKNKASIIRTLNLFQLKGFVHKIIIAGPKLKYYYSEEIQNFNTYFTCTNCKKLFVFDLQMQTPPKLHHMEIIRIGCILSGTCDKCE